MLFKLLKNEFIATGRIMGAVYAVVALLMGYISISYFINRDEATLGQQVGIIALIIVSFCMFVLTAVVMVTNFQKSLYGDQGYLSFTLPVKSVSLLTSKVIISILWFVLALACLFGSAALTLFVLKEDVMGETYETMESILPIVLGGKTIATFVVYLAFEILKYFIGFAMFTIEVYFAISIANTRLFQKHYLLWTIVFSVAIIAIAQFVSNLIARAIDFKLAIADKSIQIITDSAELPMNALPIDLVSLIASLVIGAAFFYGTFYVMSKKVNIR